jgi:hypothetical protein
VATLAERTSRFLILVPLHGRDSLTVSEAIIAAVGSLPATIKRSLTWDCGSEMALHKDITATGLSVLFAHPHSLWEHGRVCPQVPGPARRWSYGKPQRTNQFPKIATVAAPAARWRRTFCRFSAQLTVLFPAGGMELLGDGLTLDSEALVVVVVVAEVTTLGEVLVGTGGAGGAVSAGGAGVTVPRVVEGVVTRRGSLLGGAEVVTGSVDVVVWTRVGTRISWFADPPREGPLSAPDEALTATRPKETGTSTALAHSTIRGRRGRSAPAAVSRMRRFVSFLLFMEISPVRPVVAGSAGTPGSGSSWPVRLSRHRTRSSAGSPR